MTFRFFRTFFARHVFCSFCLCHVAKGGLHGHARYHDERGDDPGPRNPGTARAYRDITVTPLGFIDTGWATAAGGIGPR